MSVPPTDLPFPATTRIALVLLLAVAAGALFADSVLHPEALWRDPYHDRNTHLSRAMDVALALRAFDPPTLLAVLTRDVVWPPLHPLLLGVVLAVAGLDERMAAAPGIAGWAATVALTGLLARRMGSPMPWLAGGVAAGFALASPAFRLLGADAMLETPGAALSALVLYAFSRCRAGGEIGRRLTCLALTALFFEKFNYWLLIVLALTITLALDGSVRARMPRVHRADFGRLLRGTIAHPVGLAGSGIVLLSLGLTFGGPDTIDLFGRSFLLRPPGHLLALGYGLLLARAVFVRRGEAARLDGIVPPTVRTVLGWHVLPCALWFLVPQALMTFLWFVGPTHAGASGGYDPAAALSFQWRNFAGGFHVSPWSATLCLLLTVPGATRLLRDGAGGRAVAVFALVSVVAVVLHPQQQGRFQATSLFAVWVCAGVGAARLAAGISRWGISRWGISRWGVSRWGVSRWGVSRWGARAPCPGSAEGASTPGATDAAPAPGAMPHSSPTRVTAAPMPTVRAWPAGSAGGALALVAVFLAALAGPRAAPGVVEAVAIRSPGLPSDLVLADAYLPFAKGARGVGFVATFGKSDLFAWTVHARCRCAVPVEQPWLQAAASRAEVEALATAWLAVTPADRVILIDAPAPYPLPLPGVSRDHLLGAADALARQTRFVPITDTPARVGAAAISAWRLAPDAPPAQPMPVPRRVFGLMSALLAVLIVGRLAWPRRGA